MKEAKTLVPFVMILCVAGVMLYGTITSGHNWGDDFAGYIMQARSLSEASPDEFIEANRFTIEQSTFPLGPVAYPWGFPMLLAPFYKFFGLNVIALKTVGILSYLLFLVLLWFGFRRVHSQFWFLCLVSLFALNPTLLAFSDNILSDLPFLFLSILSLVLIRTIVIERRYLISKLWDYILIGVVIAIAFFVRTNGLFLLVSLGFSQLVPSLQKQLKEWQQNLKNEQRLIPLRDLPSSGSVTMKRLIVNLVPYAVFSCLFVVWELVLPNGGESHVSFLKNISMRMIIEHLRYYFVLPSSFFSGVPAQLLVYMGSIPFAVVGAIRRRQSENHAIIFLALTFLLYVIWPPVQGIRFFFPVLPFYVSFVLTGLELFQNDTTLVGKQLRRWVFSIPVVLVIFWLGLSSTQDVYKNISHGRMMADGPFTQTSRSMFSFVLDHTEKESTIIFFKPRMMRLMTGRKAIMISEEDELSRGNYLCLYLRSGSYDQISTDVIEKLVGEGTARLVYANSDFRVYRLW